MTELKYWIRDIEMSPLVFRSIISRNDSISPSSYTIRKHEEDMLDLLKKRIEKKSQNFLPQSRKKYFKN